MVITQYPLEHRVITLVISDNVVISTGYVFPVRADCTCVLYRGRSRIKLEGKLMSEETRLFSILSYYDIGGAVFYLKIVQVYIFYLFCVSL